MRGCKSCLAPLSSCSTAPPSRSAALACCRSLLAVPQLLFQLLPSSSFVCPCCSRCTAYPSLWSFACHKTGLLPLYGFSSVVLFRLLTCTHQCLPLVPTLALLPLPQSRAAALTSCPVAESLLRSLLSSWLSSFMSCEEQQLVCPTAVKTFLCPVPALCCLCCVPCSLIVLDPLLLSAPMCCILMLRSMCACMYN